MIGSLAPGTGKYEGVDWYHKTTILAICKAAITIHAF